MSDLALVACFAALAAVVDAIIVRRRLAVMRRELEEERMYCLHADARVTGLETDIEALRSRHAALQGLYAESCWRTAIGLWSAWWRGNETPAGSVDKGAYCD